MDRFAGEVRVKKDYEAPEIVYTEKITARAVACGKGDETMCGGSSIMS